MGWTDPAFLEDTDSYLQRIAESTHGLGKDVNLTELREEKITFFDFPGKRPLQFKNVFPWTPDGKINLAPANFGDFPYRFIDEEKLNGYPLALISPASDKLVSSTLGEFNFPELFLIMNPADVEKRSLKRGDRVRVFNHQGEVIVKLRISDKIRPGVALMPKGAWRKSSINGLTATTLAPDTVSEIGGGACFNDARVEVEALDN